MIGRKAYKVFLQIGVAIATILVMSGCTENYQLLQVKEDSSRKASNPSAASIEYKILPQDRLKVILYRDPGQISSEKVQKLGEEVVPGGVLVNAKGYARLPLIGNVKVSGLTQTQAADKIQRLYKDQLTEPSVYVEIMNKRLFVLGEVNKQGVVPVDKEKMTLFEALAHAGGFTDHAVRNEVVVISYDQKRGMTMRTVDLTDFDHLGYASLMLRPNDVVYVKPNEWKKFRVASDEYTSPFSTVAKIAAPFVTLKYLSD